MSRLSADPLADYQAHLKAFGIDRALFVHPEPYGDDHALVLDCLARTAPSQFKATSMFFPKDSDAPARLEALVKKEPRICSTRFHLHRGNTAYFASFSEPGVRALWKKAVDLNLVVELDLGPNYARDAGAAIAALFFLPAWGNWGFRVKRAAWCQAGTYAMIAYLFACSLAHHAALLRVKTFASANHIPIDRIGARDPAGARNALRRNIEEALNVVNNSIKEALARAYATD